MKNSFAAFVALCLFTIPVWALDDKADFSQLLIEDSVSVTTIAAYPEAVRGYVFEVCTYPQVIVKISDLQNRSNVQFRSVLSTYSKEEQKKIWNMVRYNGLIGNLVSARKLESDVDSILQSYPAEIRTDARNYALNNRELLIKVHDVNKQFDIFFQNIVREYSTTVQDACVKLLSTPELISLLNNNMHFAVRLGDMYKKNPSFLKSEFNALSLQLAQQKAADLEDWKNTMAANPEAESELKQAAKNYAEDNEYAPAEYAETDPEIVTQYVYVPYPYWSGYPWWYEYECWYPYPYWYHWGFYYWHGRVHWWGLPSWYYMRWHFWHHDHFYHYPHITNVYINYYNGPRGGHIHHSATVHQWYSENRHELPDDFIVNQSNRINVIKDYGQFDIDYQKESKSAAGVIDRNDFLRQNVEKYPNLKPVVKQMPQQKGDNLNERWIEEKPAEKQVPVKKIEPKNEEKKYNPERKNRIENEPKKQPVIVDPVNPNKPSKQQPTQRPDIKPKQIDPPAQRPNIKPKQISPPPQKPQTNPTRGIQPPAQKRQVPGGRIPIKKGG